MKRIDGGVTAPQGFKANGISCGIKKSRKKDLALIASERPCVAAGVFTANKVQASCVVINKELLQDGRAQAVVVNSGNANCMTGRRGFNDSRTMGQITAKLLRLQPKCILVASTGVIGAYLPIRRITAALPELVRGLSRKGSDHAAHGILTTDRVIKEVAAEIHVGGRRVRIGAIAKGAGMIRPQMHGPKHATMLCFVTTDALIEHAALQGALQKAVDASFNMISIDGDMSTNDMVVVMANGMARNPVIARGGKDARLFARTLEALFIDLAKQMIRDAEGATKLLEIVVKGARSAEDARMAARAVAQSTLVKCAAFGSDPNWGRIAAAVGYSGAHVDSDTLQIWLGRELAVTRGGPVKNNAGRLGRVFSRKDIRITVDLGLGRHGATTMTCDLSMGYVRINSAYRT